MLGVEIHTGVEYKDIIEPTQDHGWKAQFSPYKERLDKFVFDVVVGADGKKDMLPGFRQIEMRGKNFQNFAFKLKGASALMPFKTKVVCQKKILSFQEVIFNIYLFSSEKKILTN